MAILDRGARGGPVLDVQARLGALGYRIDPHEHGLFGPSTEEAVREFQQRRRLIVDGLVGEDTWNELVEAGYHLADRIVYLRHPPFRGDDVRALQAELNLLGFDAGKEDGILGGRTDRALREFQRNVGLPPDGIAGTTTTEALQRLRPQREGPGRAQVREGEALLRLSATLDGARVAVDAGHGSSDPGAVGPAGTTEAAAAYRLAQSLAQTLAARGANPLLLRSAVREPSDSDRARAANEFGAEILIAFHLNSHSDPKAEGCSTYYFGTEAWSSQAGQRLAELIQDELTLRLGLKDGRVHPKALALLRETRMPAVQIEPCFITNPAEEALLRGPRFPREVAEGVADAAERFFGRHDAPGSPAPAHR